MNTRKLTQIMLIILGILVLLIIVKAIENSKKEITLENNNALLEASEDEEPEAPKEGAAYDPNAMAFKGFEYLYSAFNSLEEGGECKLAIQEALIEYGTVVKMWKIENASANENVLTFDLISDEEISDETYRITVSESGTVIERTDK